MAITVRNVAKQAGVALGTVSRYLNGHAVREDTRRKVEQAIRDLGFEESSLAQAVRRNRSMTIGVIIPQYRSMFFMAVTTVLERIFEEKNYSACCCAIMKTTATGCFTNFALPGNGWLTG